MSQQELNPVHFEPFMFLILPVNQIFAFAEEKYLLLALFTITSLQLGFFVTGVIHQITTHLEINCLTITPKKKSK
jgi:hypothetical protein